MEQGQRIVVLGAGAGGLLTALVLACGGHEVVVLERDDAPHPETGDEAWDDWQRRGVPQFRQPHGLTVRLLDVLDTELPGVAAAIRAEATPNPLAVGVPFFEALDDDEQRMQMWLMRRPTLEMLLAEEAEAHPGVEVRRGAAAVALLTGPATDGRLNVVGVTTEDGAEVRGDLVVDCSGRRSPVAGWLTELGSAVEESSETDGFTYASRWYRFTGEAPTLKARTFGGLGPGVLALLFPSDGNVVGVAMVGSVRDPLFRRVQQPEPFTALAASFPLVAEWVDTDASEPITDVMPMGSIRNRMTRFRRDDSEAPVGVINTSDSFASTNPSLGRGLGIAADLAVRLRDLLADELDPVALVDRWDGIQQQWHRPWLEDSIASDANMREAIDALVEGRRSTPPVEWRSHLSAAEGVDADCWRAVTAVNQILASPTSWRENTELLERAALIAADMPRPTPAMNRAELEALVG